MPEPDGELVIDPSVLQRAYRRLSGLFQPDPALSEAAKARLEQVAKSRIKKLSHKAAKHNPYHPLIQKAERALQGGAPAQQADGRAGSEKDLAHATNRPAAPNLTTQITMQTLSQRGWQVHALEGELQRLKAASNQRLLRFIGVESATLVKDLQLLQAAWRKAEERLKDFFGTSPAGWDLEAAVWNSLSWEGLEHAAQTLKTWPQLQTMASRIGRWKTRESYDTPQANDVVTKAQRSVEQAPEQWTLRVLQSMEGRSGITGLTLGSDLSALSPSELCWLFDDDLTPAFLKRYLEHKLNILEYQSERRVEMLIRLQAQSPLNADSQPDPDQAQGEGPVILCLDTSGSMTGVPEQVAKALTLAMIRACTEAKRPCHLVAFSTQIRDLRISDPSHLGELLDFLNHSFRGGTDLRPALARSIELLSTPEFERADVLIVSDFKVPKIVIKKSGLIQPIRERARARLHALSITDLKFRDDLHLFDSRWHFRIDRHGQAMGLDPSSFIEVIG